MARVPVSSAPESGRDAAILSERSCKTEHSEAGDIRMLLTDFEALTFDCYGTLIDWESGMIEGLKPLTAKVKRPLTRNDILEAHARHEACQQRFTPAKLYRDLLPIVYKRMAEEWGVPVEPEECAGYGRCPSIPEEVFQARHPFERRQPIVSLQQSAPAGKVRRDIHRRGYRVL